VVDGDSIRQQFAQRRPKLRTLSCPPRAVRDDLDRWLNGSSGKGIPEE
jgi:hypothetical protein